MSWSQNMSTEQVSGPTKTPDRAQTDSLQSSWRSGWIRWALDMDSGTPKLNGTPSMVIYHHSSQQNYHFGPKECLILDKASWWFAPVSPPPGLQVNTNVLRPSSKVPVTASKAHGNSLNTFWYNYSTIFFMAIMESKVGIKGHSVVHGFSRPSGRETNDLQVPPPAPLISFSLRYPLLSVSVDLDGFGKGNRNHWKPTLCEALFGRKTLGKWWFNQLKIGVFNGIYCWFILSWRTVWWTAGFVGIVCEECNYSSHGFINQLVTL